MANWETAQDSWKRSNSMHECFSKRVLGFQTGYAENQFVNFHFEPEFLRQITVNTSDKLFFNSRQVEHILFSFFVKYRRSFIVIFKAKKFRVCPSKIYLTLVIFGDFFA